MVERAGISFEVKGTKKAVAFLKRENSAATSAVTQALSQISLFLEGEVKQSISGRRAETRSVDTGRFINSVTSTSDSKEAKVDSNVDYAAFLEFGSSRARPRRHFGNTLARNNQKIKSFLDNALKQKL